MPLGARSPEVDLIFTGACQALPSVVADLVNESGPVDQIEASELVVQLGDIVDATIEGADRTLATLNETTQYLAASEVESRAVRAQIKAAIDEIWALRASGQVHTTDDTRQAVDA